MLANRGQSTWREYLAHWLNSSSLARKSSLTRVYVSMSATLYTLGVLLLTHPHPHGILFHCTWVERGTVRVKCLAHEHDTVTPARARTRAALSGVHRANYNATMLPTTSSIDSHYICSFAIDSYYFLLCSFVVV